MQLKKTVGLVGATLLVVAGSQGIAGAQAQASDKVLVAGPAPNGVRAGVDQTVMQFVHQGTFDGPLLAGVEVRFLVTTGPSAGTSGVAASNTEGVAMWRYGTQALVPNGGSDVVQSWIDIDQDTLWDEGEPFNTTWLNTLPSENQLPIAPNASAAVNSGGAVSITLPGRDPEGTRVGFSIATQPGNGKATGNGGNVVEYKPNPGFSGDDSFTYRVTDVNGASATGLVTVTVKSVPVTPPLGPAPLSCEGRPVTIVVQPGQTEIFGTGGPDVIKGTSAAEKIYAFDGDDLICSGGGADQVRAGNGNDSVFASGNNATVFGEDGDDTVVTTGTRSTVTAGNGNDRVTVGNGRNSVFGDDGDDHLAAGSGDSLLNGGNGNDTMRSASDSATLLSGNGDDWLHWPSRSVKLINGNAV